MYIIVGPARMTYELDVNNQASVNITIYWVVNSTKYDILIPSGDRTLICGTFNGNGAEDIKFSAQNTTDGTKVLLGGKNVFKLTPTVEDKTIFVTLRENGMLSIMIYFIQLYLCLPVNLIQFRTFLHHNPHSYMHIHNVVTHHSKKTTEK